jgi:hypothetical protein
MDNFAEKWGTEVYHQADGNWEVFKPGGSVRMAQYHPPSIINGPCRRTINLNTSGDAPHKIRGGDSTYLYE